MKTCGLFASKLEQCDANACAAVPDDDPPGQDRLPYDSSAIGPYIRQLRSKAQHGLTEEAILNLDARRRATNEKVANTDVGRASKFQHEDTACCDPSF